MTAIPDPADLAHRIQRIEDIEAIKQTKYKYFRCFDTANLEELAETLTEDITLSVVGGVYGFTLEGRDAYLEMVRDGAHAEMVTQHNGHHPEIQILSDSEATGIWYLADNMWILDARYFTTGTALYWDRYRKSDGRWQITETRYERIYEISRMLDEALEPTSHYLGVHGAEVAS